MFEINIFLYCLMFIVMFLLFCGCLREFKVINFNSKSYIFLIVSDLIMLLMHILHLQLYFFGTQTRLNLILTKLCNCICIIAYYSLLIFFIYFIHSYIFKGQARNNFSIKISIIVCTVFAVAWCVISFKGIFFIEHKNTAFFEKYYHLGNLGSYFIIIESCCLILRNIKKIGFADAAGLLSFTIFPIIAFFIQNKIQTRLIEIAFSLSIVFIYNFIHYTWTKVYKKQQEQLAEEKIRILFSQIKPHFIFNVLNSIYVLCDKDTEIAKKAIEDFSGYLRSNLDAVEIETQIPFSKEVEHIKYYLELEKLRFQDELDYEFDIQQSDFSVPPLSIQPIVENAVKHGIIKKKGGGKISISSYRNRYYNIVSIIDDGAGFDIDSVNTAEKTHIGLKNAKERLWTFSGATVEIKSKIGAGTKVFVRFPLKEKIIKK